MKTTLSILILVLASFMAKAQESASLSQLDTISVAQAKDYIGKKVVLKGKIVSTKLFIGKEEKKTLFFDIDDRYPNGQINVVMFDETYNQLKHTEAELLNKPAKIKGTIKLYKNKPQLIIESVTDLEI